MTSTSSNGRNHTSSKTRYFVSMVSLPPSTTVGVHSVFSYSLSSFLVFPSQLGKNADVVSVSRRTGQQAFEGLKAYRTPSGGIQIFRPSKNAQRMMRSVAYISIPPVPEEHFLRCVNMAVARNASYVPPHGAGAALYIRPIILGTSATLALASPGQYTFCVYVTPVGVTYGTGPVRALILEDYDRVAPQGTGPAKIGGNYSPLVRHIEKAKEADHGILLHLDSQTRTEIDEFSMSGFVGIQADRESNYCIVVPYPKRVIESVTSDSICVIAKDLGWRTECRKVYYEELSSFSEVLAVGTAGTLVPIKNITRKSTKDEFSFLGGSVEPGPCCVKLLSVLKGIQQGINLIVLCLINSL